MDRNFIRTGVNGLIGNLFEGYDFMTFILLGPTLSHLFFPGINKYVSMLQVYGVFALGYFARPIGAMVFGHFGDRIGRRKTLFISMLMMAVGNVLIGVLPTYQQVGLWGPIGLVVLRLAQGMSLSTITIGAMTLTFESAPPRHRGLMASMIWVGAGVGVILSSLLIRYLMSVFSYGALMSWGWRLPFFIGCFIGIFGYMIRYRTVESVYFSAMMKRGEISHFPILEVFKKYKKTLLTVFIIMIPQKVTLYVFFIFLPTYSANFLGYDLPEVLLINAITMSYIVVFTPVLAYFSDRIGRKPFLIISLVSTIFLSITLFNLIATGVLRDFFIAQSIFSLIYCIYISSVFSISLETVPTRVRYSVLALSYNLSHAIFGGTAPLLLTYLIHRNKSLIVPAFYIIIIASTALLVILNMRETYKEVIL